MVPVAVSGPPMLSSTSPMSTGDPGATAADEMARPSSST